MGQSMAGKCRRSIDLNLFFMTSESIRVDMSHSVWFSIVGLDGKSFHGTLKASQVSLVSDPSVTDLQTAVKAACDLQGCPADALRVYKNKPAFDECMDGAGDSAPLKSHQKLELLGQTEPEAVVVAVPSVSQLTFIGHLRGIASPDDRVLRALATEYPNQFQEFLSLGRSQLCLNFYNTVQRLPSPFTCRALQKALNVSLGGPKSLEKTNIRIAFDLDSGRSYCIKLFRLSDFVSDELKAISDEVNACTILSEANILGVVKYDVIKIPIDIPRHEDWVVLKAKRYVTSLADNAQLNEHWLYQGFSRILNALKEMHGLGLVHMDVKSENVFVDWDAGWNLGDFGSTKEIGEIVHSFTDVFNPYTLTHTATAIPAMDLVLLCVMIAVELDRKHWIKDLCRISNVQERLVAEKLNTIQDVDFKTEVLELFTNNLKIVQEHLRTN